MKVGFVDTDHIVDLAAALLTPPDAAAAGRIRAFFHPNRVDIGELRHITRGFAATDGFAGCGPDPHGGTPRGCDALVFRRARIDAAAMDLNPDLRLIQRFGDRSDMIDLDAAAARGIAVSCLERPSLIMVAEHVLMFMLALGRRLIEAHRGVREGVVPAGAAGSISRNWLSLSGVDTLWGKTLGIVGMGEVGCLLAERAGALGMRIVYCGARPLPAGGEGRLRAEHVDFRELLARSDYVSLHVRGTAQNRHLIGAPELARMRPVAFLVNTSRGSVVDEEALLAALEAGRLRGAALDVHQREPRPVDALAARDDVILTPHMAGGVKEHILGEIRQVFDNLRAVARGAAPPHGLRRA
jgi:phosphoglycerate dehydrogenase-like enzyme